MKKSQAEVNITRARSMLVQQYPVLAPLILSQKVELSLDVETTGTNGNTFFANPTWAENTPPEYIRTSVAHNAVTAGLRHPYRCADRDMKKWNLASDIVVNNILEDLGFHMPGQESAQVAQIRSGYKGQNLSSEQIYQRLPDDPDDDNNGQAPGGSPDQTPDNSGCGGIVPAPASANSQDEQDKWRTKMIQAAKMAEKSQGNVPGDLMALIEGMKESVVSWEELLWRFVCIPAEDDQTWSKINRRFVAEGLYLPGYYSEDCGRLLMIIDASGSMPDEDLESALSEIFAISERMKAPLDIIVHDVGVRSEFLDVEAGTPLEINARGGTSFLPASKYAIDNGEKYRAVIWFTDLSVGQEDIRAAAKIELPIVWLKYGTWAYETPEHGDVIKMEKS